MIVLVNGIEHELAPGTSVEGLLAALAQVPPGARGVAVALDGEIVPRASWGEVLLHEAASLEIVTAVQGG